jgi:hypothetical protein
VRPSSRPFRNSSGSSCSARERRSSFS